MAQYKKSEEQFQKWQKDNKIRVVSAWYRYPELEIHVIRHTKSNVHALRIHKERVSPLFAIHNGNLPESLWIFNPFFAFYDFYLFVRRFPPGILGSSSQSDESHLGKEEQAEPLAGV